MNRGSNACTASVMGLLRTVKIASVRARNANINMEMTSASKCNFVVGKHLSGKATASTSTVVIAFNVPELTKQLGCLSEQQQNCSRPELTNFVILSRIKAWSLRL
jgi:hypothetical protein